MGTRLWGAVAVVLAKNVCSVVTVKVVLRTFHCGACSLIVAAGSGVLMQKQTQTPERQPSHAMIQLLACHLCCQKRLCLPKLAATAACLMY